MPLGMIAGGRQALEEWQASGLSLPEAALTADRQRLRAHWNLMAAGPPPALGEVTEVVDRLQGTGSLRPADRVLDIGCGAGAHALRMAEVAGEVTCLDFSSGMIERLRSECLCRGVSNIRPMLASWEEFVPAEGYDLVFSSFCPAVLDPGSVLRLESMSERHCCLVSHLGGEGDLFTRLLSRLSGRALSLAALDITFPFNMLHEMGRRPELKVLGSEVELDPSDLDAGCLLAYLTSFEELRHLSLPEVEAAMGDLDGATPLTVRSGVLTWQRP